MSDTPKHSGLGISSFVLSLVVGLATFALFTAGAVLQNATPGGVHEESPEAIVLGLLLMVTLAGCLVSFALGVAGLFQENRNRTFAILGTILSALTGIGSTFAVLLGLAAS